MEHAWIVKFEHQLESACRESQDRSAEPTDAWAVEVLAVERTTATERGLEAAKAHHLETEAAL